MEGSHLVGLNIFTMIPVLTLLLGGGHTERNVSTAELQRKLTWLSENANSPFLPGGIVAAPTRGSSDPFLAFGPDRVFKFL